MKFICPNCKTISTDKDIDARGMTRWTTSYTSITTIYKGKGKHYLPYICPNCNNEYELNQWRVYANQLPEELFTL